MAGEGEGSNKCSAHHHDAEPDLYAWEPGMVKQTEPNTARGHRARRVAAGAVAVSRSWDITVGGSVQKRQGCGGRRDSVERVVTLRRGSGAERRKLMHMLAHISHAA